MAQKVFPQWSPVVKAHNEDQQEVYIPAAIIHAQTRNGEDELIVGAANMQFDPETGDYLPTHAGNPVEVRARALETLLQTLGKEETLALVKAALDVLVSKDFATQTTLAAVLEKLADLATESTLEGVKSAVDALAGTVDAGAQKVTLSGQIVENVNGALAIRTKQVALAYQSWDFDGQDNIIVTAGSSLREMNSHQVNGFSTLAWIVRVNNVPGGPQRSDHRIMLRVRWQSTPGDLDWTRSVWQELFHDNTTDYSASGLTDTRGQYVFLELTNYDTVDHMYHVHAMLRV